MSHKTEICDTTRRFVTPFLCRGNTLYDIQMLQRLECMIQEVYYSIDNVFTSFDHQPAQLKPTVPLLSNTFTGR